jgi:penicillin-binding protein 1C
MPDGFTAATVCPLSGRLAGPDCPGRKVESFVAGSEPFAPCPFHLRVRLDRRNGLRASPTCPEKFVEERAMLDLPETYTTWAAQKHLELAPRQLSPLCPRLNWEGQPTVTITEPRANSRYLWDPDTPTDSSALRLTAKVEPPDEEIVWEVDGVPVAKVGYPHSIRWSLGPGTHTIAAKMSRRREASKPITVVVEN